MNTYLASIPQWIAVLLVPKPNGKTDKIPVDPRTGFPIDAHQQQFWTDYGTAVAAAQAWGPQYIVGFVLTERDDLFCLDIDGARQADGTWSPLAQQLAAGLPGCMMELSQSGQGLHIWGRFPNPPPHRKKNIPLHLELYTERRFIAIGTDQRGEIAPVCAALPALIAQLFPPAENGGSETPEEGPRADWRGPTDDAELLRRAMQSRSMGSVFGTKASFADLWHADAEALAKAYPADRSSDEPFDRSSADAALAAHLAFWTGCDVARTERLMRQSKLARAKWDDRSDYLVERTVRGQCGRQTQVLQDKAVVASDQVAAPTPPAPAVPPPPGPPGPSSGAIDSVEQPAMRLVDGQTFLSPSQQVEFFKGCVYVRDIHRALVPRGDLLTPDKFKTEYGGYTFSMDNRNEKVSRNAWEAFTENQATRPPRADTTCFRPQMPLGAIITRDGQRMVNTYIPQHVRRQAGDAGPFLRHLQKMIPDEYERKVVFYYLCCLAQRQGQKSQWALVIQGVEGNGKSLLAKFAAHCVGRRYTYKPRANKIGGQFNGWVVGNILYVVDELMVDGRQDLMDELKILITEGEGIEVERKGVDGMTAEACGNFLCTTNHKNAVLKTRNDRRWCVIQSAQQSVEDLARDGITGDYMHALHAWARKDGFAIVAELLFTTPIPPEFDFTLGLQRAPRTASYDQVLADSMGPVEQEILEAVQREDIGFRGGWISSGFLDALLKRIGKDKWVSHNRRRDVLKNLGYDWHPTLCDGRVANPVMPDGAKVKLFYDMKRADLRALGRPVDVAAAYSKAQGV